MGNSTSAASSPHPRPDDLSRRTHSPVRGGSPAPSAHRVHRSLRTKKKSLELPDLASLALTPASPSPNNGSPHSAYRRPRASSPIPIPVSANPPPQTFRPQNNLPSAAHIQGQRGLARRRSRARSYLSSAYPSSHSFASASPPNEDYPVRHEFVPEVVHSTIPLALTKADQDAKPEPIVVFIKWRAPAKNVLLARAGDDNWSGRQSMEYDIQTNTWVAPVPLLPGTHHFKFIVDDLWRIADDYPTAVDDRDGSLANYVNVTPSTALSSSPPLPTTSHPTTNSTFPTFPTTPGQFHSFWSPSDPTGSAGLHGSVDGDDPADTDWTTVIPPALIHAASEEEHYLTSADSPTSSSSVPAPNIPPAPVLPRHLDKLILNVRPTAVTGPASAGSGGGGGERERERRRAGGRAHRRAERERERERERDRDRDRERDRGERTRAPMLGMTAALEGNNNSSFAPLPIVTPSGTDVTASVADGAGAGAGGASPTPVKALAIAKLDAPGVADDASVLPVPSHVVLHHLSTSAIRNGVLAVANTTRYRKKYITTIYYKPT